jgi:hypothetical protein
MTALLVLAAAAVLALSLVLWRHIRRDRRLQQYAQYWPSASNAVSQLVESRSIRSSPQASPLETSTIPGPSGCKSQVRTPA